MQNNWADNRQGSTRLPPIAEEQRRHQTDGSEPAWTPRRVSQPPRRDQPRRGHRPPSAPGAPPTNPLPALPAQAGPFASSPLSSERRQAIFRWLDQTAFSEDCLPAVCDSGDETEAQGTEETEGTESETREGLDFWGPLERQIREIEDRFGHLLQGYLTRQQEEPAESTPLSNQPLPSSHQRPVNHPATSADTLSATAAARNRRDDTNQPSSRN